VSLTKISEFVLLQVVRCAATGKGPVVPGAALPAPPHAHSKAQLVSTLLAAKDASGKTFSQIAKEVRLTNVYTTQLFYHQVRCSWGACHRQGCLAVKGTQLGGYL
jgi:hypothetical protein